MKRLLRRKFKLFRKQTGFTLLEVLIAVGILGVIGVGLLTALETNARATRTLDEKVEGANLAAAYLEVIKESPYSANYTGVGDNITMPTQYSVNIETECSSDGTTFGDCAGSENETLQRITVQVFREDRPILSLCTFRTKR